MTDKPLMNKADYFVDDVALSTARQLIAKHHYAHGSANTATYRHGLFHKDNPIQCLGAAIWIPPTKGAAIASYDGDWRKVLSLSRLVIVPGMPQNSASFLIGRSIKRIKVDGKYECLITYADEWRNHEGKIYQATNWEYLGKTAAEPTFTDVEGRLVARKAGPHTRTYDEMRALGYTNIGKYAKHKYRLILKEHKSIKRGDGK